MNKKLSLITGGTSGIGYGVSKKMALRGQNLLLVYRTNDERSKIALDELRQLNDSIDIKVVKFDLSVIDNVNNLIEIISSDYADYSLENFVSCHGQMSKGLFLQKTQAAVNTAINEHLLSNVLLTHGLLQKMCVQKYGRVLFLSSLSAHKINQGQVDYSLSKSALEIFVKGLTAEYYQRNVTFNCVCAGLVETLATSVISEELNKSGRAKTVKLDEVVELINFICSENASTITGSTLRIDGGQFCMNNNHPYHKLSFYKDSN